MKKTLRSAALCMLSLLFTARPALCDPGSPRAVPVRDADFIISSGMEPVIDPTYINDSVSADLSMGLFEGLMQYDPETNFGVPALAESFTTSEDGLVVTFFLRDAKWSDGHPVTAGDFVYAMRRILDPANAAPYAYMPAMVIKGAAAFNKGEAAFDQVGIRAVDDRTLEYSLAGPADYFIDMTCHEAFLPVPKWAVDEHGEEWTKPENIVTNGPFLLAVWKPHDHILMKKNPGYWDAAQVKLESVEMITDGDSEANYRAYLDGQVDWLCNVPSGKGGEVRARPDYHVDAIMSTYYYSFNVTRSPTDKVLVRKALSAAIDKDGLIEEVVGYGAIPADSMTLPIKGYSPPKGEAFDPAKARRYLAQAGYPDGLSFPRMTILCGKGHEYVAGYIRQQWKQNLNIDVSIRQVSLESYVRLRSEAHDFQVANAGWVGDYLDPNTMLDLFMTGAGDNYGLWSNPEFDRLIALATAAKGAERLDMLRQAEAILLSEAVILPLDHFSSTSLIDTRKWGGWSAAPLDMHPLKPIFRKVFDPGSILAAPTADPSGTQVAYRGGPGP